MGLIRFAAKVLLVMFALPALGLIAFNGGIGTGLLAALLIGVVGVVATIALIPALLTFGLFAQIAAGAVGGALGARIMSFVIETLLYALTLGIVAWMMSGVALLGFWPTIGAAAILGFVSNILTPRKSS